MHHQQAAEYQSLQKHLAATLADRALERQLVEASHEDFETKVQPGCLDGIEIGNSYAGEFTISLSGGFPYGLVAYGVAAQSNMSCRLQNEIDHQ